MAVRHLTVTSTCTFAKDGGQIGRLTIPLLTEPAMYTPPVDTIARFFFSYDCRKLWPLVDLQRSGGSCGSPDLGGSGPSHVLMHRFFPQEPEHLAYTIPWERRFPGS